MKILDNHVHTHFSIDAKDTMEDVIKRAIDIGVDYLTFTDHLEYNTDHFSLDIHQYISKIAEYKEKYKKDIEESIDHVGIYCGKNKKGEATWCHCSSSKGGVVYEMTDIFTHYYSANDYLSE